MFSVVFFKNYLLTSSVQVKSTIFYLYKSSDREESQVVAVIHSMHVRTSFNGLQFIAVIKI